MLRMAISLLLDRDSVLLLASFGATAQRRLRERLVPTMKQYSAQRQVILATDLAVKNRKYASSCTNARMRLAT